MTTPRVIYRIDESPVRLWESLGSGGHGLATLIQSTLGNRLPIRWCSP